jgi:hypothetical protein
MFEVFPSHKSNFIPAILMTKRWHKKKSKKIHWNLPSNLFPEATIASVQCSLYALQLLLDYRIFPSNLFLNFMEQKTMQTGQDTIGIHTVVNIVDYISGGRGTEMIFSIIELIYNEIIDIFTVNSEYAVSFITQNPFLSYDRPRLNRSSKFLLYKVIYNSTWGTFAKKFMEIFITYETKESFENKIHSTFRISDRKLQAITNHLWNADDPHHKSLVEC